VNPFTGILTLVSAALQAITAYFRAKPIMALQASARELRQIKLDIIRHEAANTPEDKRLADTVRVFLPEAERLHASLLATVSQSPSRDRDPHIVRAVPVPD
jgi:hypothetical protein